jgi:hypothetical protein
LRNRSPLSKEEVRPLLERFVSARQVTAKLKLRQVNIRSANRDLVGAIASGIGAMAASPNLVWERLCDEVLRNRPVMNGINPEVFEREKSRFWDLSDAPSKDI